MNTDNVDAGSPGSKPESPKSEKREGSKVWRYAKLTLKALGIFALAYLILVPIIQPLLVRLYANLPFFLILLAGVVGGIVIGTKNSKDGKTRIMPWSILVGSCLLLGVFTWCTNNVQWIYEWQMAQSMDVETLPDMPFTKNNRIVPRPIALELVKGENTDNRLESSEPHVVRTEEDGKAKMWWVAPMSYSPHSPVPNIYSFWYGRILGSVAQVIKVDAGEVTVDRKAGENAFFYFGHDSLVSKILFRLRHPFSKEAEVVYWQKPDGSWVYLRSYTSYKMTWTLTMIPTVSGVMEVGPHGGFTNHSVQDAAEKFKGASLYPPALTNAYAQAYAKFHHGAWNYWMEQKDIYEISEDDPKVAGANRAPFFQDFEGLGLQQYVAFEPAGAHSYALREVLYFDAITGKVRRSVEKDDDPTPPIGPRKALHDVVNADWDSPWQNYLAVEPLLVNGQKGRFYLVFVIKDDKNHGASVRYVLVNARTRKNNAKKFDTVEELYSFLGEPAPQKK